MLLLESLQLSRASRAFMIEKNPPRTCPLGCLCGRLNVIKFPPGCSYSRQNVMKCPNGCPSKKKKKRSDEMLSRMALRVGNVTKCTLWCSCAWGCVIECPLGYPSSGEYMMQCPVRFPLRVRGNMIKCLEQVPFEWSRSACRKCSF